MRAVRMRRADCGSGALTNARDLWGLMRGAGGVVLRRGWFIIYGFVHG